MIKGSYVALITPFNADLSIDYTKLEELIDYQIENKTDGIVILGTTGEASTLDENEAKEIVAFCVRKIDKRLPIIVGCASNNTAKAVKLAEEYEKIGADMLLVLTPYYNKTNEEGMTSHFLAIADAISIPMIMYNVPARTGCNITINNIKKLSRHKNIIGIKDACGDINYAMQLVPYLNDNFVLLCGNDNLIIPYLSIGAKGAISVWANIMPLFVHEIIFDWLNGHNKKASDNLFKYYSLIMVLSIETNPIPVKEVMDYLEMAKANYRLPLTNMSLEHKARLIEIIEKYKEQRLL